MESSIKHQYESKRPGQFIQLSVIALCIYLIYVISAAILNEVPYLTRGRLMRTQFWICIYFIAAFIVEFFIAGKNKWRYLRKHFLFLLISVPYLNLIAFFNSPSDMPFWSRMFDTGEIVKFHISRELAAFLKFIPLLRGGYAIAFVVAWLSSNRISSLFISYLITLISTVYFGSLIFFEIEHPINPMVHTYGDAAWWAFMDATTVGSNIYAVSPTGKILSVILAALGMMMFPIFTVYITNLMTDKVKERKGGNIEVNPGAPETEKNSGKF